MDIRYSCNQRDFKRYTTQETRDEFLITGLYQADEVVSVYSHVDRMVTFGCMPVNEVVSLDKGLDVWANFGTKYVLERREIGIFNLGGSGMQRPYISCRNTQRRSAGKLRCCYRRSFPEDQARAYHESSFGHWPWFRTYRPSDPVLRSLL